MSFPKFMDLSTWIKSNEKARELIAILWMLFKVSIYYSVSFEQNIVISVLIKGPGFYSTFFALLSWDLKLTFLKRLSSVSPSDRLSVNFHNKIEEICWRNLKSSANHRANSTKLVTKKHWVKEIQMFLDEGPRPFTREDNEIAKKYVPRITGPSSTKHGKKHSWVKVFQICPNKRSWMPFSNRKW